MLVYDITSRESFDAIGNWLDECRSNGNPEMTLVLVGNKTDLPSQRQVSFVEGETFAKHNGMLFLETSAKVDSKIAEIFTQSANIVMDKIARRVIDPKNEMYGIKMGSMVGSSENLLVSMHKKAPKKSCCE